MKPSFWKYIQSCSRKLANAGLFGRMMAKLNDEDDARRRLRSVINKRNFTTSHIVIASVLTLLLYLSVMAVKTYLEWPPKEYSSETSFNLTANKATWDIAYGTAPDCNGTDCYVLESYPSDDFKLHSSLPLPIWGLLNADIGEHLYMRVKTTLPENLRNIDDLVFHAYYLYADKFEFYVNDQLIKSAEGGHVHIPIPKEVIKASGEITIAIKVISKSISDPGFDPYTQVIIGRDSVLRDIIPQYRSYGDITFYWFLIPRITITILFGFIFFSFPRNRENYMFVVYGLFSSLALFMETNWGYEYLDKVFQNMDVWYLAEATAVYAQLFLVGFLYVYFRKHQPHARTAWLTSLFAFTLAIIIGHFSLSIKHQAFWVSTLLKYVRYFAIGYGFYLSAVTTLFLIQSQKSKYRLWASMFLTLLFTFSAAFIIYSETTLLMEWVGQFTFELAFFVALAALVAMEFGATIIQRDALQYKIGRLVDQRMLTHFSEEKRASLTIEQEAVVMFVDIRSFTSISERFPADKVLQMLNQYFDIVAEAIQSNGGVVDKFLGDGVLAVWGIPSRFTEDNRNALNAALDIRKYIHKFNSDRIACGNFPITVCAALHQGRVVAGIVGSATRVDYTVIGETVNATARVEQLTKTVGADILLTEEFVKHTCDKTVAKDRGSFPIRGLSKQLRIYHFIGIRQTDGSLLTNNPQLDLLDLSNHPERLHNLQYDLELPDYSVDPKVA